MTKSNPCPAGIRQRKRVLLPQISQLARQGLSSREIGEKLALSKSTVGRWLRKVRRESTTKEAHDPAKAIRNEIALGELMLEELLDSWRNSKEDKQVRIVEKTGPAGDPGAARKKRSIRRESQTGNATYMREARETQRRINDLRQCLLAEQTGLAGADDGPDILANLTDDDLEKLTSDELEEMTDEQLFTIQARLHAKYGLTEPLLTKEDLHNMNGEELAALERKLLAEVESSRRDASH